jgi:hypothetical protein
MPLRVAERAEAELGEEQFSFIDGFPADWQKLPIPEGRIVVGLDGGYVRNWDDKKSNFEVIVGRSVPEDRDACNVGLAHGYDNKPKRRLFGVLKNQGLQANQDVTFLTDGGEEIRALTEFVTPASEHVLDWFHITMRVTVLEQYAGGVAHHDQAAGAPCWPIWSGSSGCFGMATSIVLENRLIPSRTTWTGWRSPTRTWANLPSPPMSSLSTSNRTQAACSTMASGSGPASASHHAWRNRR